jgi:lariat debranching enzyme
MTIFIGGNHEASNLLFELYHGGWVAPNIYYLGNANVVNYGGLRIAGISGIFKAHDYNRGYFETFPLSPSSQRSIYHVREYEIFRLMQLMKPVNIFLSHDWPRGIAQYGNVNKLKKQKPFLASEIDRNVLGNPETEKLLHQLKPEYWFSAHLHVKYSAIIPHTDGSETRFLALDKCLRNRQFLQVVDVNVKKNEEQEDKNERRLCYDAEWLAIVRATHSLLSTDKDQTPLPYPFQKKPSDGDVQSILNDFDNDLQIPLNFTSTAEPVSSNSKSKTRAINPSKYRFESFQLFISCVCIPSI